MKRKKEEPVFLFLNRGDVCFKNRFTANDTPTNQVKLALSDYNQALKVAEQINYTQGIVEAYIGIGKCYQVLGKKKEANDAYSLAKEKSNGLFYQLVAESNEQKGAWNVQIMDPIEAPRKSPVKGPMLELNVIPNLYDPFVEFKKKETLEEKDRLECLNNAYREAIRKIVKLSPACFGDSPIWALHLEILTNDDLIIKGKYNIELLEEEINKNKELQVLYKALDLESGELTDGEIAKLLEQCQAVLDPQSSDFTDRQESLKLNSDNIYRLRADIEKLRLIKQVTAAHEYNLVLNPNLAPQAISSITLKAENLKKSDIKLYLSNGDEIFKGRLGAVDPQKQAGCALDEYNKALEVASKINYQQGIVEANIGIGKCHQVLGRQNEAMEAYESARVCSEKLCSQLIAKSNKQKGDWNVQIVDPVRYVAIKLNQTRGDEFFKSSRTGNGKPVEQAEHALKEYKKALEGASKINYQQGIVEAYFGICRCNLVLGRQKEADKAYQAARESSEDLFRQVIAKSNQQEEGWNVKIIEPAVYDINRDLVRGDGIFKNRLSTKNPDSAQQTELALEKYKKALEAALKANYEQGIVKAQIGIGKCHQVLGRLSEANEAYKSAKGQSVRLFHQLIEKSNKQKAGWNVQVIDPVRYDDIKRYLSDGDGIFKNRLSTGESAEQQAKLALEEYKKAFFDALQINYTKGIVEANIGIGRCYQVLGQKKDAIEAYQEARGHSEELFLQLIAESNKQNESWNVQIMDPESDLKIIRDIYNPFVEFQKKATLQENDRLECLNNAYRNAINTITDLPPSLDNDSPLWALHLEIITSEYLRKGGYYNIELLKDAINENAELKILYEALDLKPEELTNTKIAELLKKCEDTLDPEALEYEALLHSRKLNQFNLDRLRADIEKLRLIKMVTEAHEYNLALNPYLAPEAASSINYTVKLENILDKYLDKRIKFGVAKDETNVKQYKSNVFTFFQHSYSDKEAAVLALKEALEGRPGDLLPHLSALRKGDLGNSIRDFVKQGFADELVGGKEVRTVSDFIEALNEQVNLHVPSKAS